MSKKSAFTLIELLVVVGIIGILAAIALPNYNSAIIKSRVAQVKMDLRNLGLALDSYRLDHNVFPRKNNNMEFFAVYLLPVLTTPVAYISVSSVEDPFGPVEEFVLPSREDSLEYEVAGLVRNSFTYTPYISFSKMNNNPMMRKEGYSVASVGPDRQDSYIVDFPFPDFYRYPGDSVYDSVYNPTNGIRSSGDIGYFGGDLPVQGLIGG